MCMLQTGLGPIRTGTSRDPQRAPGPTVLSPIANRRRWGRQPAVLQSATKPKAGASPVAPTPVSTPSTATNNTDSASVATASADDLPDNFRDLSLSVDNLNPPNKGKTPFMEASICRLYYFSETQLHVVEDLLRSMKESRRALTALAVANILLSLAQASGLSHNPDYTEVPSAIIIADSGLTVGDVAYWADSLMVAGLISYAIGPFQKVLKSRSQQMAYTFKGLNRLALIFQQLAVGSIAVSTVTGLEAAAKYPPLVVGTSALFFAVAVIRSGAMWWTISRHTQNHEEVSRTLTALREPDASSDRLKLLDRWAAFLAFGYLLQYEQKEQTSSQANNSIKDGSETSSDLHRNHESDINVYEFSLAEERLLRGLTEATSTAGLALGLQAFVTLMLTVADFGTGNLPEMIGNGINATNKAIMTYLLFSACSAYDRALHTAGIDDVQHLMDGLGKKGLTGLFESMAVLSYAITIATLAGLVLPFMEDNMMAKLMGDGLSHRGAEAIVEGMEYLSKILRGW